MTRLDNYESLVCHVRTLGRVAVAFSGGVDSLLMLMAAKDALGKGALAVTAHSPLLPAGELDGARAAAALLEADHLILSVNPLEYEPFVKAGPKRCYFCKRLIMAEMTEAATRRSFLGLIDGTNFDDLHQDRPGLLALQELGVISPLAQLKIGKTGVRAILKEKGSPFWNKPAQSCLATRIVSDNRVDLGSLKRIDQAETALKKFGFSHIRVRLSGQAEANIETECDDLALALGKEGLERLLTAFDRLGFEKVFAAGPGGQMICLAATRRILC